MDNKKVFRPIFAISCVFIFLLFFYMSYKTPIGGDDWGYYLTSQNYNAIQGALMFYQTWSGRFFSEIWCFFMSSHKFIWNIVNSLLFVGLFICVYKLIDPKKDKPFYIVLIIGLMFTVENNLRMETYTWITGTIYVVSLFLSLLYLLSIDNYVKTKRKNIILYFNNIFLFIIGMMIENIAVSMLLIILVLVAYAFIKKDRYLLVCLLINLVSIGLSFAIMRMSPGSAVRLLQDHAEWSKLSFFTKIANQYPNFIKYTFINNDHLIITLSVIMIITVILSNKINKLYKAILICIDVLSVVAIVFASSNSIFSETSLFSYIYWPCYVIGAIVCLCFVINDLNNRNKAIVLFLLAGFSTTSMLLSPIFGSRTEIYFIYYVIVLIGLFINEINTKYIKVVIAIVFLGMIINRTNIFVNKYRLVGIAQQERLQIIEYYKDHPEVEEAWIPRFPIDSIHGADIEEGDDYHFETFKEYYGLPQPKDKIIFYFE